MKRRSHNLFASSLITTGVALAAVGCGEDTGATSPEALQAHSSESGEVVFTHPDSKPYNPARSKAEQCLFDAAQTAAGLVSMSSLKVRSNEGTLEYVGPDGSDAALGNTGVSTTYPVRMRVDFAFDVAEPQYSLSGTVDVNATRPGREDTMVRPDDVLLHTESTDGKSYWMGDDTRISHIDTGQSELLGDVDTDADAFTVCSMISGQQGTAGFKTSATRSYEK